MIKPPLKMSRRALSASRRRLATALLLSALTAPVAISAQTPAGGVVVIPHFSGGGATDEIYYFDLASGRGHQIDRLGREPRVRQLVPSLFDAVGRPSSQPAIAGELHLLPIRNGNAVRAVLFVEASTGYVAYFADFGKNGQLGPPTTTTGRPFGELATTDGNFALLPRRDGAGRTQGAYLFHAGSGRCIYLDGLAKLATNPQLVAVEGGLPVLTGRVTAVVLEARDGETAGYLVLDNVTGDVYLLSVERDVTNRLGARKLGVNLFQALPREAAAATGPQRFVAIALEREEITRAVLVIDTATGKTALIDNVLGADAPVALRPLALDLTAVLGAETPRHLAAVPLVDGGGNTYAAWVLAGTAPRFLYLANLLDPASATVAGVQVARE